MVGGSGRGELEHLLVGVFAPLLEERSERVERQIAAADDASLIRLAGALLIEQNDEWLVGRKYLSAESIALALALDNEADSDRQHQEVIELTAA